MEERLLRLFSGSHIHLNDNVTLSLSYKRNNMALYLSIITWRKTDRKTYKRRNYIVNTVFPAVELFFCFCAGMSGGKNDVFFCFVSSDLSPKW